MRVDALGEREALAERHDAEPQADGGQDTSAIRQDVLGAPAADVEGQQRVLTRAETGDDTANRQPRLLFPADDLDGLAGGALDDDRELTAIGGLSHGARRDDPERTCARVDRPSRVFGDRRGRPTHRCVTEPTTRGEAFTESRHALVLHDGVPAAVGGNLGDEQTDSVGAEVDGGEPHLTATPCRKGRRLPFPTGRLILEPARRDYFWRLRM